MFKKQHQWPNFGHFGKSVNKQLTCKFHQKFLKKMRVGPKNNFTIF